MDSDNIYIYGKARTVTKHQRHFKNLEYIESSEVVFFFFLIPFPIHILYYVPEFL